MIKIWVTYIQTWYYLVLSQNIREMCLIQAYRPSQYNRLIFIVKDFIEIYIASRLYVNGFQIKINLFLIEVASLMSE